MTNWPLLLLALAAGAEALGRARGLSGGGGRDIAGPAGDAAARRAAAAGDL